MATTLNSVQAEQERQIDNTQNQILDTSRNIKRLAVESEDVAQSTMFTLADQKDKLNKIEEGLDNIDNKLDDAEEGLDELDKCCGLCICPWNRWSRAKKTAAKKRAKDKQQGKDNAAADVGQENLAQAKNNIQEHDINLKRIVEDDSREDEINENVKYAAKAVSNLHAMALDMGMELESQNRQLDRINDKTEDNNTRLDDVNKHAQKRLK